MASQLPPVASGTKQCSKPGRRESHGKRQLQRSSVCLVRTKQCEVIFGEGARKRYPWPSDLLLGLPIGQMGNWVDMGTLAKSVQVGLRRGLVGLEWQSQYLNMVLGD